MPACLTRASALAAVLSLSALLVAGPAAAQPAPYPNGPVRFIVPATPGGTTDVVARLVAKHLADAWASPVIVENRAGGGGVVGASYVVGTKPDGQTVLIVPSAFGVRAALDHKLTFDPMKDLVGIGLMARAPSFLVVSPSLNVKTVPELVAASRAAPNGVIYGSAGVGSTGHLHAALFASMGGFPGTHAAYRGTPEAVTDAMLGRVQYVFSPGPNALPLAKDGRVVILASSSAAGAKFLPGVPTVSQAGLPGYEGDDWFGALVPNGTPMAVREKLSRDIAAALAKPEVRDRLNEVGADAVSSTPSEFDAMLLAYVTKTRKLGDEIGISLN